MLRLAAVAHVHPHNVPPRIPGTRGNPPHIARVRRALEAMHKNHGQPARTQRLWLPVGMAKHTAPIRRVHQHRFRLGRDLERRAGIEISNNGL